MAARGAMHTAPMWLQSAPWLALLALGAVLMVAGPMLAPSVDRSGRMGMATIRGALPQQQQKQQAQEEHVFGLSAARDGYDDLASSVQYYPWDIVLEPHHEMTLTLDTSEDANEVQEQGEEQEHVSWTLVDDSGNTVLETETKTIHEVTYTCTVGGTVMSLEVQSSTSGISETFSVACKYVRRNIYSLTDDDLQRFLSAFSTVAHTEYVEGLATYGEHFTNLHFHAAKHAWNCTSCTPYHSQWSFLTSHEAFMYEIERAMQLVDPSVALHYWDFPLDFEAETEEDGPETLHGVYTRKIWSLIGMGSAETDWVVAEGPFAYTSIPHKSDPFGEHISMFEPNWNAYGYLSDLGGTNPSAYLTRVDNLCGYDGKLIQGKAKHVRAALETKSSFDFSDKIQGNVHAGMHSFGGNDDCVSDFNELEAATGMVSDTQWIQIFETAVLSDKYGLELTCPDEWVQYDRYDSTVTDTVCTETCAGFLEYFGVSRDDVLSNDQGWAFDLKKDLNWTSAIKFLKEYDMYDDFGTTYEGVFTTMYNDDLDEEVISFPDTSTEDNDIGFRELLTYTCVSSRGLTPLLTPYVSPLDPIFYLVHVFFNRMMEARRIVPAFAQYGLEYVESEGCWGYGYNDPMPFYNFMGDTSGKWYTNKDLFEMFDPASVSLPYIWDDIDFSDYPEPQHTDDDGGDDDMDDKDDYVDSDDGTIPVVNDDDGNKPIVNDDDGDKPVVNDDDGDKPVVNDDDGDKPIVNDDDGDKPIVNDDDGDKPVLNDDGDDSVGDQ